MGNMMQFPEMSFLEGYDYILKTDQYILQMGPFFNIVQNCHFFLSICYKAD